MKQIIKLFYYLSYYMHNKLTVLQKMPLILIGFYLLYLFKSALGINLSTKYSAPKMLKIPLTTMDCVLPIKGHYCRKSKQEISLK